MTNDTIAFLERFYGRSVRCRHCGGPGTRNGKLSAFGLCFQCWSDKSIRAPYAAAAKAHRRRPKMKQGPCIKCRKTVEGKHGVKCPDCSTAEIHAMFPGIAQQQFRSGEPMVEAPRSYDPAAPRYCIHGKEDGLCAPCERCERSGMVFAEQPCNEE